MGTFKASPHVSTIPFSDAGQPTTCPLFGNLPEAGHFTFCSGDLASMLPIAFAFRLALHGADRRLVGFDLIRL